MKGILIVLSLILLFSFILLRERTLNRKVEAFLEFIHIPKNAGTTIENIADSQNVKWGRFKPEHEEHKSINEFTPNCTYWHLPPKHFNRNSLYKKDETFCVLRNPYERMVSEYKYRNKLSEQTPEHLNAWLRKMLVFGTYNDGELNCHFLPQCEYLFDSQGERTCDNVLNFENLTKEFNELTSKHGIDIKLNEDTKYNTTEKSVTVADLDQDVKVLIERIYEKDFEEIKRIFN